MGGEMNSLDDENVAFPVPDGVTARGRLEVLGMPAPIQVDDPRLTLRLRRDDDAVVEHLDVVHMRIPQPLRDGVRHTLGSRVLTLVKGLPCRATLLVGERSGQLEVTREIPVGEPSTCDRGRSRGRRGLLLRP